MSEPIWLSIARAFRGLHEIAGPQSEAIIVQWAKDIEAPGYTDDDQAWCALFMNRIMKASQLPMAGEGYDLLRAKTFISWGTVLTAPTLGAVLVFSRPEGAHVGLYLGERADAFRVFGGNQGNAVSETWIDKARLSAMRWPPTLPIPEPRRVLLASTGEPLSSNEA